MYRVLNCGVGMVLAVNAADVENALSILKAEGENAWVIGEIREKSGKEVVISDLEASA